MNADRVIWGTKIGQRHCSNQQAIWNEKDGKDASCCYKEKELAIRGPSLARKA